MIHLYLSSSSLFMFLSLSLNSCFLSCFQGIPGVHGKKGKMGRPVKFSLNILLREHF